jgi:hypothetical protein
MSNTASANADVFNAVLFGEQRSENRRFLQRHLEQASSTVTEHGRRFLDRARKTFESYDSASVSRSLRAIKRKLDHRFDLDDIRALRDMGALQNAGFKMQRWNMANPKVRQSWQRGRCHGYADTYVDMEPGALGETHTDYKKVMNGLPVTDDNGDTTWVQYFDALDENGDEELQHDQQLEVLETWDWQNAFQALGGDDSTDPANGSL